ncbi:MAG TPA: hypothetical protein VGM76_06575 [Lacipirellulaceae bacterium]|jgi:hypothetical protein
MDTEPHQIPLSAENWAILVDLSTRTGKPPETVLADALWKYEPSQPSPNRNGTDSESAYDSLARSGFIGCIKGGPPDLSTNPKYMEGFGESDY